MKFTFSLISLILISCLSSCVKEPKIVQSDDLRSLTGNVLIMNEGLFMWGNAEISIYNKYNKKIQQDLYKYANNTKAGDVLQHIYVNNNRMYLVFNNSGKIDIIDPSSLTKLNSIYPLKSPRKILIHNDTLAYITDLYAGYITVFNLISNSVIHQIKTYTWTEDIIESNGKVYFTAPYRNYVYIINPLEQKIIDSIPAIPGGNSMQHDLNGNIWVACLGDSAKKIPGGLINVNSIQQKTISTIQFSLYNEYAFRLVSNKNRTRLYYINKHVYELNPSSGTSTLLYPNFNRNLYGLGCDPENGDLYLADAVDFISHGKVYRCTNGNYMDTIEAGIIPSGFYFY